MVENLARLLPPEGVKIILVLFLSFMVGLEREEHKGGSDSYAFGGVRTYPLIGLIGYAMALISGAQLIPIAIGFAVVAGFMLLSYRHKIQTSAAAGATSEMSGLVTYLLGPLVYYDYFWVATTLAVLSLLLLELKVALESLARRTAPGEILTFAKFLLLSAVILPILPDAPFGPFHINPFRAWLVVVAVSTVSYGSYVVQKATKAKAQGGVVLAALLGGAYSSTITTVVLSRRARDEQRAHLFAGAILMASGVMYLRLAALVGLFSHALFDYVGIPFIVLSAVAVTLGWIWTRVPDPTSGPISREFEPKNPLELGAALIFAGIFVLTLVATHLAVSHLGSAGAYGLAAVMGLADVDPFIMGMTQSAGSTTAVTVAATAIVIAAAANNLAKGCYAYSFADRTTGRQGLIGLVALALAGLVPLLFVP
jgi:uncharacterized membrane protein (DUF4010 family)